MISDNNLNIKNLATVDKTDFNTKSEAIDKALTKAEKAQQKALAKQEKQATKIASKQAKKSSQSNQQRKGFFNNKFLCGDKSLNLRLPSLKVDFDRLLNWDLSVNICGKQKKIQPYAAVMGASNIIRNNPGLLSGDKDAALDALLKSNLLEKMVPLGLGRTIGPCLLRRSSGSLYGSDAGLGPTLKSKNALREQLYGDQCGAAIANVPFVSNWLDNSTSAMLLSTIIGTANGQAGAYDWVMAGLSITGNRGSALGSLLGSLAYAYDYNVRDKMRVTHQVFNSGKVTSGDYMYFQTSSDLILDKLDEELEKNNPNTNTPAQDFDIIIDVINKADATWNQDDNYYKTNGNKSLTDLANSKLLNKKAKKVELTGNYTTVLEPEHHISIINKFNGTTSTTGINKLRTSAMSTITSNSSNCTSCSA